MAWKLTQIEHKGEQRIKVDFPNNAEQNQKIRSIQGAKWSASLKAWHVPNTAENKVKLTLENQSTLILEPVTTSIKNNLKIELSQDLIRMNQSPL
jgi:integrase/recombinase XerD